METAGIISAILLVSLIVFLRRRSRSHGSAESSPWLGPIFRYELVRIARRGQQSRLRGIYALLLLAGLAITHTNEFGVSSTLLDFFDRSNPNVPIARLAKFAETFLVVFLVLQALAVVVLTPAIVGGAIAEDKERGTFDYLLTSTLSNREIVLGKLCARLVIVGSVLLTGLPVLSMTMFFGGVDGGLLLTGFGVAILGMLSFGSYSILMAVNRDGLKEVLVNAYLCLTILTLFGLCCGCVPGLATGSPVATIVWMFSDWFQPSDDMFWLTLGIYALIHTLATVHFLILAVRAVRQPPRRFSQIVHPLPAAAGNGSVQATGVESGGVQDPSIPAEEKRTLQPVPVGKPVGPMSYPANAPLPPRRSRVRTHRSFWVRPLTDRDDPLFWKERYFVGRLAMIEKSLLISFFAAILWFFDIILLTSAIIFVIASLQGGRWHGEELNPLFRCLVIGITLLLAILGGVRAAGTVGRERQRQTLDSLLMLPVARETILWAKWSATAYSLRWGLLAMSAILVSGVALIAIHPLGVVIAVIYAGAYLLFTISLGIWLSVRCTTVPRATTWTMIVTLSVWIALPLIALTAGIIFEWGMLLVVSPPIGLWQALLSWSGDGHDKFDQGMIWGLGCLFAGVYLAASYWLYRSAIRGFTREGR